MVRINRMKPALAVLNLQKYNNPMDWARRRKHHKNGRGTMDRRSKNAKCGRQPAQTTVSKHKNGLDVVLVQSIRGEEGYGRTPF
jgi:hypothetical protein